MKSEKLLNIVKEALFDPDLQTSYKFPVLMYASLLSTQGDQTSSLLSFYYDFTSQALK